VWSRAGRSGQRLVQAPGKNCKRYGFGLVDWRDGHLDFALAQGAVPRPCAPSCAAPSSAPAPAAASPWWSWTTSASTRPGVAAAAGAARGAGRGPDAGLHPDL
jgi:hypothetical protein